MIDYLEEYCNSSNIKLVYTENKVTVLSSGFRKGYPIIRVHKFFKNCPKEVVQAIMRYLTAFKDNENQLEIIKNYIEVSSSFTKYKILPPDVIFKDFLIKNIKPVNQPNNNESSLIEFNISQITMKDFQGNKLNMNKDKTIDVQDDDFLELDIIVDNHYKKTYKNNNYLNTETEKQPINKDEPAENYSINYKEMSNSSEKNNNNENVLEDQINSYNINTKRKSKQTKKNNTTEKKAKDNTQVDDVVEDKVTTYRH